MAPDSRLALFDFAFAAAFVFEGMAFGGESEPEPSKIKSDERVVFFDTAGWFDADTGKWVLPVHGWIYEPEESKARKALYDPTI